MAGSVGELSKAKVRALCETLERLLKPPVLTDEERAALHAHDVAEDERTKDDWWKRYAEVRSYARRKEKWVPDPVTSESIDEGPLMDVLNVTPVYVLMSSGERRKVVPASWDRIMVVEDLWYWLSELEVARKVVREERDLFDNREDLLDRIRAEAEYVRGWLYTQVCADGPRPLPIDGDPPAWSIALTQNDHMRLIDAWLHVHTVQPKRAERVIRMKYPVARDPDAPETASGSLAGFPFMLASIAYREQKSPDYVRKDRALTEVMATYMVAGQQQEHARQQSKAKAEREREKRKNLDRAKRGRSK